jgi:hypothetical protein
MATMKGIAKGLENKKEQDKGRIGQWGKRKEVGRRDP